MRVSEEVFKVRKLNALNIKIGLVQGFYWTASCVFVSFLVRLLSSYGYSDYEAGIALSVSALSTLTMQPLLGRVADKAERVSFLIVIAFLFSSLFSLLLIPLHESRVITYVLIFLIFAFFRSLIYVIDIWSISVSEGREDFSYGFTRSFGALFYALSAPLLGISIDKYGSGVIIPLFVLFSFLSAAFVLLTKENRRGRKLEYEKRVPNALKVLLSNKHYVVLLISYTFVEMTSIPGQNYLSRKFEVLGYGEFYTGLALLLMGLLQLPTLNAMDRLQTKVREANLIWVSLFGLFLRSIILAFSSTPFGVILSFLTEPFAFGLYIGAIILYMRRYLDSSVIYFGMTLYSALTSGIGGIVGNYTSGLVAEKWGINTMFALTVFPAFLGLVLYTIFLISERKRTK